MKYSPWLGYLLAMVGLIQPVGYFLGISKLTQLGFYSAASPMAIAFSHQQGIDSFALEVEYSATLIDGRTIQGELTPEDYRNYQAHPYLRNIFADVYRSRNQPSEVQRLLQWGYCAPGEVARALMIPTPISTITFEIKSQHDSNQSWNLVVNCPR